MDKKRYAGVVVKCKNKVLLCKRNNLGSLPGEFSIPAGKIKDGEEIVDAARREFFEETAIDIDNKKLNFIGVIKRHGRDGKKIKGLMYVYQVNFDIEIIPDLENAIDGIEHSESSYYGVNDLPTPMGEQLKKLIEIILS